MAYEPLNAIVINHKKKNMHKRHISVLRGSKFIGVSVNNHDMFQIMVKVDDKNQYLGSYEDITTAALINDIVRIQCHGENANSNYDYTKL